MNRRLQFVFIYFALMVLSIGTSWSQGLPCNGQVNISIAADCQATITPTTMHQANPGTLVRITIKDFGLSSTISDANLLLIFPGATIGGQGAGRWVEAASLVINTKAITSARTLGGAPGFSARGMWMTKVSVFEGTNSCWGDVMIEDKLPPAIVGPVDRTVSCLVSPLDARGNPDTSVTGNVIASGSCSDVIKKGYIDEVTEVKCNPQSLLLKTIRRIFIVENPKGMQTRDTQMISVMAVNLISEVACPTPMVEVKCNTTTTPAGIAAYTGNDYDAWPYVTDAVTGVRYYLPANTSVCNLIATYTDTELAVCKPNCKGTVKIHRHWTVLDWCAGRSLPCDQIIKKVDDIDPVISGITTPAPYSVTAWGCDVDITLPGATVTDVCDPDAQIVDIRDSLGLIVAKSTSAGWRAVAVPCGRTKFYYTASDCCGNTSRDSVVITVQDRVAPVATAKEFITVSLTRSGDADVTGVAKLFVHQVDNGSYDNCTKVYMEVRREAGSPKCLNDGILMSNGLPYNNNLTYNDNKLNGLDQSVPRHLDDNDLDTDKGQFVKFCCEDIGKEVKVWLRVWDDASKDGIFGNAGDNYNETWANVKVEDKIVPKIFCKPGADVSCDRDTSKTGVIATEYNFTTNWVSVTGKVPASLVPSAEGVCGNYEFEFRDAGSLSVCNTGTFTRTYRIKNHTSVSCTQVIRVTNTGAQPKLEWPIVLHNWNKCTLTEEDVNLNTVRARLNVGRELSYEGCDYDITANGGEQFDNTRNGRCAADYLSGFCKDGSTVSNHEDPTLPYNVIATNVDCGRHLGGRPGPASTVGNTPGGDPRFNSSYKDPGCNVYGKKITIEEYTVGEGCRKWFVRWDYINWCCNEKSACRSTIYKYEDKTAPSITLCDNTDKDIADASCTVTDTLRPTASDAGGCEAGLTWRVRIYPGNKTATGNDFIEINTTGYNLDEGKRNENGQYTGSATTFTRLTGTAPSLIITNIPAGEHGVRYLVTDGCGNVTECTSVIGVWPKAATPYCVSLSSAVMKNGLVDLWARDFDKGSFTNCGKGVMFFTFNRLGRPEHPSSTHLSWRHYFRGDGEFLAYDNTQEGTPGSSSDAYNSAKALYDSGNAQLWMPDVTVRPRPNLPNGSSQPAERIITGGTSGMQFGCKIANANPIGTPFNVEMRVWDARAFKAGTTQGSDFCRVSLTLVDNQAACSTTSGLVVNGTVATSKGDGVTGVETKLAANLPEFPVVSNTQNGVFSFAKVPAGVEFELSARKNNDHINGVNTLDLVTIQRHILGIAKLGDAYKYVAADADNNQKINLSDLVELRKLVLGITNELPGNTSWRFVDAAQKFADISNPWPLDEVIVTTASANANNFVAVKVGDVNIDAAVNATSANLSSRSANTMKFVVDQTTINAGEVVSIPVRAANFNEAYGFQMTTELKGLELVSVQSGAITIEEGMVATPKAGVMTMSWTSANGSTVSDDAVLFTINVKAKSATEVSKAMAITSSVTEAVAFTGSELTAGNVELEVRGAGSNAYALGQNEPNPFKAETTIKFSVPEAGEAKFRVVDVTGRILVNEVIKAAKGENVITLKRTDIAATGVVYYQIESGDFTATKKMVIIE